ncbi:transposase-like protein [Acinetobacter lwoffii]|uniref:Transposase-like protein n=1 Tax=Acinetobacter lwoffii TaxID=28090 RepID=A0AAW8LMC1_ACILW|nr:transposase [Acinetobacter lwoffii]MDR6631010.1 transposase-like protein [Acinetobacter lwoffii]
MSKRRHFTKDFKEQVAALVLDDGRRIMDLVAELNIDSSVIQRWVAQLKFSRTGQVTSIKALTIEQAKIVDFMQRIAVLEKENEALLAKQSKLEALEHKIKLLEQENQKLDEGYKAIYKKATLLLIAS